MTESANILIVDDIEVNRIILHDLILSLGHTPKLAEDGVSALEQIHKQAPDIVLLDIRMPGMDGYEVLQQVKDNFLLQHIPIIVITAIDNIDSTVKCIEMGAEDYLVKPFNRALLKARIAACLEKKYLHDLEKKHRREIEEINQSLQAQKAALEESEALRKNVEHIIQHDLKSPLNGIITFSELLAEEPNLNPDSKKKALGHINNSGHQMLNLINRFADIYKMETGQYHCSPSLIDIVTIIEKIILNSDIKSKNLSIDVICCDKPITKDDTFMILGEYSLCYSMLANLLKNAIEASPSEEHITITLDKKNANIISIHNKGAVPKAIRNKFFDKYTTADKVGGTGLGSYSAKLMAETQGGNIHLETSEKIGTTITVSLPNVKSKHA
ncbi:hybrid sensor histidine kinase/response regulator [Candidatus Parabeggiatoa sp. HSG14]|nr:hybrid sensor histidine kinase/response regulator [Thiotrichales bacterium HSG14]